MIHLANSKLYFCRYIPIPSEYIRPNIQFLQTPISYI